MPRHPQFSTWNQELAKRFPDLPDAFVVGLTLYSFGMVLASTVSLTAIALRLILELGGKEDAMKKRLKEFYKEAGAKSGSKRKDFDVTTCFGPLLSWILSLWPKQHLVLAIDVTNFGERFHVLCVSVVVSGVGIPVAWKVLYGGEKGEWNPHWDALLRKLKVVVPESWTVLVLSDRGLESPTLFALMVELKWHPLMRVKKGGKFRPKGWKGYRAMHELVKHGGLFAREGLAYTRRKMPCTLLACWQEGYDEPWLLLTDLPPECANPIWYGLRAWIEQGFKVIKGGGWDWEKTRIEDPARVERQWLAIAVATLWVVTVGSEEETRQRWEKERCDWERELGQTREEAQRRQEQERYRLDCARKAIKERKKRLEERRVAREKARAEARAAKNKKAAPQGSAAAPVAESGAKAGKAKKQRRRQSHGPTGKQRLHSLFRLGLAVLHAELRRGEVELPQRLHPEPLPRPEHAASTLTEEEFLAQTAQAA